MLFFGTFASYKDAETEAAHAALSAGDVAFRIFSGILGEPAHLEDAHLDHAQTKAFLSQFFDQAQASQNERTTTKMVYYAKKEADRLRVAVEAAKTPEDRAAEAAAARLARTPAWLT